MGIAGSRGQSRKYLKKPLKKQYLSQKFSARLTSEFRYNIYILFEKLG